MSRRIGWVTCAWLALGLGAGCDGTGGGAGADQGVAADQGAPADAAPADGARPDAGRGDAATGDGGPCDCPPVPCAESACVAGECLRTPLEGACDDGDPCTVDDACHDGACTGSARDCGDGEHCTDDRCVAGPVCADGAAPVDGRCIIAIEADDYVEWAAARADCRARGGDFPVLADAADNARARHAADVLCGRGAPAFLGLEAGAGGFRWTDESAPAFTAWAEGAPGDAGPYAAMLADGTWVATDEPLDCYLCTADPQPFACVNAPGDPAVVGLPETCNGEDDDCDGLVDEVAEGAPALCDDGDLCTEDTCLGAEGCVQVEAALACEDQVGCTVDRCDPELGCAHEPDDSLCDDGVACTIDRCDAAAGCVHETSDAACDDGVACTTETCDATLGCQYAGDDAQCDDGIACTADTCVPFTGCDHAAQHALCVDGNACTDDICDPARGCAHPFNEAPCDDGSLCTLVDRCVEGECVGSEPRTCDDQLPCTADGCNPATGCVAPLVAECDEPGPAAGYYEGSFQVAGDIVADGFGGNLHWVCEGALGAVVDASRTPDLVGIGDARCRFDADVVEDVRFGRVDFRGDLTGEQVDATAVMAGIETVWQPLIFFHEGRPVLMTGLTQSSVPTRQLVDIVNDPDLRFYLTDNGNVAPESFYLFQAALRRVPVFGTCCGPLGCEPSEDALCYRRGGEFSADDAGRCCVGDACDTRPQRECDLLGGVFVPTAFGACCTNGNATCQAMASPLCASIRGVQRGTLSCDDANRDGLPDACGAPADFGYAAPPGCALSADGRALTVTPTGGTTLVLRADRWTPADGGFRPEGDVTVDTPFGALALPELVDLHVGCGARFGIVGHAGAVPALGGISTFPSAGFSVDAPRVTLGYAYGYELLAEDVEGPFADGRPYLFASASASGRVSLGGGADIEVEGGDRATLAVDPTDPAFVFAVGGDGLHAATAGLVNGVGLGLSRDGNLTWRSAVDIFDGQFFTPAQVTGHIWRAGDFPLVPLPALPANVNLDGDLVVNVGPAVEAIEPLAQALVRGDPDDFERALLGAGAALSDLTMAGNANRLYLSAGPVELDVGAASWKLEGGRLSFTGEAFTPGEALARGEAGELFRAFSAITIRSAARSWGHFDDDGSFRVTAEVDVAAGPFELEGVRLVLDSSEGIRIEGGAFGLDFGGFLDVLESLMDCDFVDGGAACNVAGIRVGELRGTLGDGGFRLAAHMGVPVLGEADLTATVQADGAFHLRGEVAQGFPGFSTARAVVELRPDLFTVATEWAQFGPSIALSGTIGFDGSFALRGTGGMRVLGFEVSSVDVAFSSGGGLVARGSLELLPGVGGARAEVALTVPRFDQWRLEGSGQLRPFGYSLANVRVSASAGQQGLGLLLEGDAHVGPATARLSGRLSPDAFSLTGVIDLTIGRFRMGQAQVTLDAQGLQVSGLLDVGLGRIAVSGRVETNGDFRFASNGSAQVPIAGVNLTIDAAFENRGGALSVSGNADLAFAGQHFRGRFAIDGSGYFHFTASIGASIGGRPVYAQGAATVTVSSNGFSARFDGRACLYVPLPRVPDICFSGSFGLGADGTVCFPSPVGCRRVF